MARALVRMSLTVSMVAVGAKATDRRSLRGGTPSSVVANVVSSNSSSWDHPAAPAGRRATGVVTGALPFIIPTWEYLDSPGSPEDGVYVSTVVNAVSVLHAQHVGAAHGTARSEESSGYPDTRS